MPHPARTLATRRVADAALLLIPFLAAAVGTCQDTRPTPAEQFASLRARYERVPSGSVTSNEERLQHIGRVFRHRNEVARQLVDLAEQHPKEPVALDALLLAVWQVNTTPWPLAIAGEDAARPRAFELLQRDHWRSDKLGPLCQRIAFGFCHEYEAFLRAILDASPHRDVRAQACFSLARFLSNRLLRIDLVREQPALAKEFGDLYGDGYLQDLLRQDRAQATKEAQALFERAARDHGDAKLGDVRVAEASRAGLFELLHLRPGCEVPEIDGEDQDGKPCKLSDYRGKVVLLDFWHQH
jgi:hypothetical protein